VTARPVEPIRKGVLAVESWSPASATTDTFRYVDISSLDRETKTILDVTSTRVTEAPSRARQLLRANDVLVSTVRPNLNAIAIVPAELDGAIGSTGFTVLRPNPETLNHRFLYYWVRHPDFVTDMAKKATGASYPAVSDRIVLDSLMPMPSIPEQERIAEILDKADAIARKRKQAIALTEDLLRSTFLEMFGDPVTNPKGWPVEPLGELADVNRGKFSPRPRNDPRFYGGSFPFIQTGELRSACGLLRTWRQTLNHEGQAVSRRFERGTVAISIAANIGDTALVDFDFFCPDSVVGIEPKEGHTTGEFLELALRFFQPQLLDQAPETAQKNINLEVLRPLELPRPPIESQARFSAIYRAIYALSYKMEASAGGQQELFGSLVQRAFAGTLTP
jgi:type I restriction enzyme S subunit